MRDVYDWQKKRRKLPQIAPYGGVDFYMSFMDGSVGWADAGVLIPYRFGKLYGDDSLIHRHYDGMVRYARFMIKRCTQFTPLRHHLPLKGEAKKVHCQLRAFLRRVGGIGRCIPGRLEKYRPASSGGIHGLYGFYHGAYDGNRRVFGKAAG